MSFIPGLELNEKFYRDAVSPILAEKFPRLRYSAALMGYGSDVLGFDTPTSMDHNWGPRLQIFLSPEEMSPLAGEISDRFRRSLPFEFNGFPTNYCAPRYDRTQSMEPTTSYPVNHLIEVTTINAYFSRYLGARPADIHSLRDWSTFDDQKLLEITSGKVFHDGLGSLEKARKSYAFFPRDILLARLAGLWKSVEEDEPLIGRTIELGTIDGTKILAARLVETCIKICMYLEGKYLPYRKWLYRSFQTCSVYPQVFPLCMNVLRENDPEGIEGRLCDLYEKVVDIHNSHGEMPALANRVRNFFNRPYKVIFAETIVEMLRKAINDPEIAQRNSTIETLLDRSARTHDEDHELTPGLRFEVLPRGQLDRIESLWLELNRHHLERSSNFKGHYREFTFERRREKLLDSEKELFIEIVVAQADGETVGYCISSIDRAGSGEIDSFYVRDPFRHLGVGSRLMEDSLTHFREKGVSDISIQVAAGNEEAFSFYERFGFAPRMHVLKLKQS